MRVLQKRRQEHIGRLSDPGRDLTRLIQNRFGGAMKSALDGCIMDARPGKMVRSHYREPCRAAHGDFGRSARRNPDGTDDPNRRWNQQSRVAERAH